jgi:hypothetical protein
MEAGFTQMGVLKPVAAFRPAHGSAAILLVVRRYLRLIKTISKADKQSSHPV